MDRLSVIAPAVFPLLFGLWFVLRANAEAAKIQKRLREGGDRYHREQEELRAYPWLGDPRSYRRIGALLIFLGVLMLGLAFAG